MNDVIRPSNEIHYRDGEVVALNEAHDLFSCPWCAGRSFAIQYTAIEGRRTGCHIECALCPAEGPYHETEAAARAGWNRRDWNAPEQPADDMTHPMEFAQKIHEQVRQWVLRGGGDSMLLRADRAMGVLFSEVDRLEKIAYPIGRGSPETLAPSSNGNNALPVGAEDDPLLVWVLERYENCIRLAAQKKGQDRDGWLEDATHFQAVLKRLAAHGNETEVSDAPPERYVRYYRDVLKRIANGYDTPQSLATLALDWEIPAQENAQKASEPQDCPRCSERQGHACHYCGREFL